jgi:multiple sugar transport system substrate-binding protein
VKYYTSAEVQAGWARASNYFPVRESVAEGLTDYFEENPQYEAAFNMLEYGKAEPPVGSYDLVRGLIADALVQVVDGADVTETATELQAEATELLEESQ